MNLIDRINAFKLLKEKIDKVSDEEMESISIQARQRNGWFTKENVIGAFEGISSMLADDKLTEWTEGYHFSDQVPKVVGIVMAGNIPLVGFHDLLCVLVSGHFAAIKPSTDDTYLTNLILEWITEIEPKFKKNIEVRDKLTSIDAVIATGSDNTSRYFEYYFKDIPHIIRKNRTSVAVLNGEESTEEIRALGEDIFSYFGLGCRNVSKIFTPVGHDFTTLFPQWEHFQHLIDHHKYRNNYDYHKSIYLVNKTPHLDSGFLLTVSSEDMVSPISVIYHQEYDNQTNLKSVLDHHERKIQCIVGEGYIPFGQAQRPELWDYADNIDVMNFLSEV